MLEKCKIQVDRWHQDVARISRITTDVYLRRLGVFCTAHDMSILGLEWLSDQSITNLLMETISGMEERSWLRQPTPRCLPASGSKVQMMY
ncbi:MAG: hypothetical protein QXO25_04335 [Candidatus Bathyarchaeia archaeon]